MLMYLGYIVLIRHNYRATPPYVIVKHTNYYVEGTQAVIIFQGTEQAMDSGK